MIDLRSDTVTKPTPEMRRAMAEAEVGDDVLGDDPTVIQLEEMAAVRMDKEAALYVPSGCMANMVSLLTLTGRNEEVICGSESHVYTSEVGGVAILGNVFMHVLPNEPDGTIPIERLQSAIRFERYAPLTRAISLENTHNRCYGSVLSLDYLQQVSALASSKGIALHLDGARIFNAAAALDVPVATIAAFAQVVNFCLSKGLSAPVGSLVCGPRDFIQEARRTRRMLGGGMRQAGILAAAGIVALNTMVDRLVEDHENARLLTEGLANVPGIRIEPERVQTNLVFFDLEPTVGMSVQEFLQRMRAEGVLFSGSGSRLRAVTHYGISCEDIQKAVQAVERIVQI
jgi:threonine aldolase